MTTQIWPEGVPRNYNELFNEYGSYIAKRVMGYNKVERNYKDLLQHVWLKLQQAKVLEKFVERANRTVRSVMTGQEAIAFLGITRNQWKSTLRRGHADEYRWAPHPVDGPLFGMETLFPTTEVLILDEIDPWRSRPNPRVMPRVSVSGFRSYLTRAIANIWKNWCRTHSRKYKESLMTPTTVLSKQSDGSYHQVGSLPEYTSAWETTLVGETFSDEELASAIDFRDKLQQAFEREGLVLSEVVGTEQGLEILDHISNGSTIREAIKAQAKTQARQKVKAFAS